MIKGICVSYLLGLSYIDLRTIRYVTQINLGIKVTVLFYSPRSFHTKEDFFLTKKINLLKFYFFCQNNPPVTITSISIFICYLGKVYSKCVTVLCIFVLFYLFDNFFPGFGRLGLFVQEARKVSLNSKCNVIVSFFSSEIR